MKGFNYKKCFKFVCKTRKLSFGPGVIIVKNSLDII